MEPSSSNFKFDSLNVMFGIYKLPFLRAGINRLLYPQKYILKETVQVDKDSNMVDDDRRDEAVLSFCELVFSYYGCLHLLDIVISKTLWCHTSVPIIMDAIIKRFNFVKKKKYATFHEVHKFFVNLKEKDDRVRILQLFQFSDKTIIEIRELLEEDDRYKHQLPKTEDDNFEKEFWYLELNDYEVSNKKENEVKPYSEDSHRRFSKLIKRGVYLPLFFAVQVFNHIIKSRLRTDHFLLDFAFVSGSDYKLNTLSLYDAFPKRIQLYFYFYPLETYLFFQDDHSFSDCKFTKWVDEWLENFDSFVKIDEFQKWIDYESDEFEEDLNVTLFKLEKDIIDFLLTRGWNFIAYSQFNENTNMYVSPKEDFKKFVGDELKRQAVRYSIIQEFIPDAERTVINWWLNKTHYYTIFNKLVEYYSTAYSDNGQRQTPLQESGSSAIETSNEVEQQNIPDIVEDKDEAHKEWFVRVHEKKINAQPDEWNKKLYTCLDALYESLVKKGLMCESSKKELFIYRFSGFNIPKSFNPLEKIRWEGSNVLLGYLVRCLITYTGSDAKGLGTVGTFFESKKGKNVNLGTAIYISKEEFNQSPKAYGVLSRAVEILKECGFEEVETTSTRKRDK